MTKEEKKRLLAEIEKQYKWLMTKSPTIYMIDIAFDAIRKAVRDEAEQEPKISLEAYKQVAKERDIAIEQLHELGYEFGEKIEPTKNDLGVDCISRIETIDYLCKHCPDDGECFKDCDEIKHLRQMPSITPQEPKTGHWIAKNSKEQGYDIGGVKTWYIQIMCSECGFIKTAIEGYTGQYHYCPSCGAKMVETQESEVEE